MEKIAFVSTFPPYKCAIAVYDKKLAEAIHALSAAELTIISEGGEQGNLRGVPVVNAYSRSGDFKSDILNYIERISPTLVHFQHAPDLFPDNRRFLALLADLSTRNIRTFITFHTVYEDRKWRGFYARASTHASFIVHNRLCREALAGFVSDISRVHVIPHGTEIPTLPDAATARHRVGLASDGFVFLFFGAIHVMKNLHTMVRAFRIVAKKNPNAHLLVAGRPWRDRFYNRLYINGCKLASLGSNRLHWHDYYIADELVHSYFAAADVVLLPYWQKYHSASGVFHMAMGAGKPVLCSDSPKFAEVGESFAQRFPIFIPPHSTAGWARAMARLMDDGDLRQAVGAALKAYGETTTWRSVAARHLEVFDRA